MAWSLVATSADSNVISPITAPGINTTGANLLIVYISQYASSGSGIGTLTDSYSNTWTGLTAQSLSTAYGRIYYCENPAVGSGHTFSYSNGSFISASLIAEAWSGADTGGAFDQQNGATNSSAGSLQPGSITPTANGELVVSLFNPTDGTSGDATVNSGFTLNATQYAGVGSQGLAAAYLIQTTAAAVNPTWTVGSGTGQLSASIASFKVGGSSPDVTVNLTGQSGSFSAGSISANHSNLLSGQAGSFSAGTISANRSIPLTGATGAFSAGSMTAASGILLSGTAGTFSTGTITVAVAIPLVGQPGTFAAGTITYSAGGDVSVVLTGQAATFDTGTLTPSIAVPVAGQAGAFATGTLAPAFSVTISGATGTFSTGNLTYSQAIALQGAIAYFSTGIITTSGGTPVVGGEARSTRFIVNVGTLMVRR